MHIIKKDSRYMLFDNETLCLYRLNKTQGEKLYAVGDELVGELCQKISANKSLEPPRSGDVFTSRHASRRVLVISQIFNLRCKYGYVQQGTYGQKSYPLMSFDTLKASVLKTGLREKPHVLATPNGNAAGSGASIGVTGLAS